MQDIGLVVISDVGVAVNICYLLRGWYVTPILGVPNNSPATLAIAFQTRSLDVVLSPEPPSLPMWSSGHFIQSVLVYSHPDFLIVFSSPQSLKPENAVYICWY